MALIAESKNFASPDDNGTQNESLTGAVWGSEAPKIHMAVGYNSNASAAVNTNISNSIGWATNDADCAIGFSSQNGVGTAVSDRIHTDAYCIHPLQVGGGTYERAVQSSYSNAPVVGHTWSSSANDGYNYFLMALGGSDITNVSIDTITGPTSTGDVSYTGVGFKPDFLFVVQQVSSTSLPVTSVHIANGFGMSDGTTSASVYMGSQDALTTSNTNSVLSSNFIHVYGLGDGGDGIWDDYEIATVKSLDADGYTFTWGPVGGIARYYSIIAVKGPVAKVIHALQAASNTTSDVSTATYTTGTATVKPNADGTGATQWAITGGPSTRYGAINNGTASPDDTDYINNYIDEGSSDEIAFFGFENMPVDFVTATSVTAKIRQRAANNSGADDVRYQIFKSDESTPLTDEITLDCDGTEISTSFRTDTLSFVARTETNKTAWDGAVIKVIHGETSGGDDPDVTISEMQLEIAYVTSTVDTESGTGAGFVPKAGICIGAMKTESQVATHHNRVTIGTWDAQDNMDSMGWMDEDNQSTTDADSYISPTHSINNYNHAQTIVGQATVAAEGNGIRETWTNTNGTQYAHAWLLLGDTPSEGGGGGGGGGTPATSIVPKTNALLRPSFSGM
jgi:hypothetical protein